MTQTQNSLPSDDNQNRLRERLSNQISDFVIEPLLLIFSLFSVFILVTSTIYMLGWINEDIIYNILLLILLSLPIILFIVFYDYRRRKRELFIINEIERTSASLGEPEHYFEKLVKINVKNIEGYYGMVEVHTARSFNASLTASIIGFVLIVIGLVIFFMEDHSSENVLSYIITGGGLIIEFIAGVFFYLYNRTVLQLKDYHDKLIRAQNILLYFKVLDEIEDKDIKKLIVKDMLPYLVDFRDKQVIESH